MSRRLLAILWGAASVGALGYSHPGLAQQGAQPVAANKGQLEEVVVTARRVEERQQATPIAVTSLSANFLKQLDITKVEGLDTVAPNIIIAEGVSNGMGTIVYIRGIGAISVAAYSDPPVSIYVDGVVQARPVGNAFDLPDVDRIEILRGPQGTLFGRNTTGGAVTIYTKKPAQDFGGSVEFGYGNYNEINTSLVLNTGEIGDSGVRSKFTIQRHSYDGFVATPGRDAADSYGYYRATSASFALSKEFGDNFTVDNRAFIDQEADKPNYQLVVANALATKYFSQSAARGGPPLIISPDALDVNYVDPRTQYDPSASAWGDTLTLNYDVNAYLTLKSITGYRSLTQQQTGQLGGSYLVGPVGSLTHIVPIEYVTPNDSVIQDQISEELQATGKVGEFNYVAGLYYFHEKIDENQRTVIPTILASGLAALTDATITYTLPSTSYAGYANVGYRPAALGDKLEVSGGIRYTQDTKTETAVRVANGVHQGPQYQNLTWDNVGWSASVDYQWTEDLMTYARASSAYRAGGFNPSQIGVPAFNPETAKTIEAGFKTEWFDRRVRVNGAGFKTYYSDLQINQRNAQAATSIVVNAGKATFTGFELEGEAILGGGFQLNGTVGYVDPEYQSYIFKDASGNPTNIANLARFPMVSKWTYNIGGQYSAPETSIGVFTARINYSFQSSHYFSPVDSLSPNNATNPSGEEKNLKASLALSDLPIPAGPLKDVRVEAYGDNLTDNRYRLSGPDLGAYATAAFNRPRSYGVRLSVDF